jgi:hypothetical protein
MALTLVCLTAPVARAAENLPPTAKVLDPDIIFYNWPYPVVSPDGQWVAYISKGFVCVCNVNDPSPRRLSEVPNTWTHVLAQPEYAYAEGDWGMIARKMDRDEYQGWVASVAHTVVGLQWTDNGDGVVFAYQGYDADQKKWLCDIRHAATDGTVTSLAKMDRGITYTGKQPDFMLSHDRRFLVIPGYYRPLIWDLTTNKPRATPFLNLTPSPISGRWLGVEKDTRQLVITDENFGIAERFDFVSPAKGYGRELLWSPNERFVIWKNQVGFDYYSNWEGGWIDLKSREQCALKGSYMEEKLIFTGRNGEIIRVGAEGKARGAGGLATTRAYFEIYPNGDAEPEELWSVKVDPSNPPKHAMRFPDLKYLYFSPDYELFAVALHRPVEPPFGLIFHLMDRQKNLWRMPGADNGKFLSPFEIAGFAENGKTIIAFDKDRLFSLPVSTIEDAANKTTLLDR